MSTETGNVTVAIVEDNQGIASLWQDIINHAQGMICVGKYRSAEEASSLFKLAPQVIIMDIGLPEKDGVAFTREVCQKLLKTEVLICTVFQDTDRIVQALQAGAAGYILKSATPEELLNAIWTVHRGGSPIDSMVARRVIALFRPERQNIAETLTKREEDILRYVAKGYRNKEIAEALFISIDTVRAHVRNIYGKLQVNTRVDAVRKFFGNKP